MELNKIGGNFLRAIKWHVNSYLLLCFVSLLLIGLVLVFTSSPFVATRIGIDPYYFTKNHIFYMILGFMIMIVLSSVSIRYLKLATIAIVLGSLGLMVLVVLFAPEIKGARRWIYLFGFSIQPSEFLKVSLPVAIALIYENFFQKDKVFTWLLIFLLYLVIIVLLLLQPDFGMSVVITASVFVQYVLTGLNLFFILLFVFFVILFILFAYLIFPHVAFRISSFFSTEESYQIAKSIDSFQNGGFLGTGPGRGYVKEFLPDAHTDFIFAVAGEEFGLFMLFLIIGLYIAILYISLKSIKKQSGLFSVLSIAGLVSVFGLQAILHISSNLNLVPTKGMTLPLISYGGSSILSMAILAGLLLGFTSSKNSFHENIKTIIKDNEETKKQHNT